MPDFGTYFPRVAPLTGEVFVDYGIHIRFNLPSYGRLSLG